MSRRSAPEEISAWGESLHSDPFIGVPCSANVSAAVRSFNGARSAFRILKITQTYYPFLDRGGPPVKVRALARGLAAMGHAVTVVTCDLGIARAAELLGSLSHTDYGLRCEEGRVEALYLAARGCYRSLTWNPAIFRFCAARLKSFDIVHIYGSYDLLGPVVARACRKKGIPYLFEPMGMFRPIVRNRVLKSLYRHLLGAALARDATRVITTSAQESRELIEEGVAPTKIVLRRNGVEPFVLPPNGIFRRKWNIPADAFVVLFLGRIVRKKSPELLLEAFSRWRRSSGPKNSFLVLAGPAENANYHRTLEEQVIRSGLGGAVLFTGPLYGEAKWSAFVDSDVFVLPSQNENFGNAAAEAVSCGTPVVVTDSCGIAPLIQGRAGMVIHHECRALVGALHQLSDLDTRQHLKLGCLEVARELGWDEPLSELDALYAELLTRADCAVHRQERANREEFAARVRQE